jgi:thiol:disulfide interchange protein/DsbC/DsbD-like thiol-disulfide interchange protein
MRKLLCSILFVSWLAGLSQPASSQVYEGRQLVKAELIADIAAIVPGKPFTAGLLLHMVPGWHTYWRFPGDAGIPTEIKWNLPADWKVGPMQWPIPLKLNEPGDIQIYGYHDEVLLMQQITPPASIAEKNFSLNAVASWLVCEKICIPGNATVQLNLPVGSQSRPANQELFTRYQRSLPQPWPDAKVGPYNWQRSGADLLLAIKSDALSNYPSVEFFPLPEGNIVVGHPKTESLARDKIQIRVPLESREAKINTLNGLVVFGRTENGDDRNAWIISSGAATEARRAAAASEVPQSVLKLLLFGFLGGFILNLMPCVLPVISLKIFGFVRHAGDSRRRILRSGLAFIAGIFTWFIGLALVLIALKSAGRELTWALQFTNPYFVLAMSVVVLIFALNLFGVFEISLPQSAAGPLMDVTAREGDAGSFFQGVFATILATPCTAPYLGTALGYAFTQSPAMILVMFAAIGAGMSAPYLLLSAQPAWLRFLPKPGPWMERVKQLMGFLLFATLIFLLSVLGAERGVNAVVWTSAFLLVVSLVCWMKGTFLTPSASTSTRVVTSLLAASLIAGSAVYFIGQKFRVARLSAPENQSQSDWQPFTPERLQSELAQGHSVFVDFTAAWCITCKFNEATVLETAAVRDAFKRNGIVKLKADWTNADPAITKILKQFGRPGVPFYVLYPAGESPITFPELLTKNILLDKLETITPHVAAQ